MPVERQLRKLQHDQVLVASAGVKLARLATRQNINDCSARRQPHNEPYTERPARTPFACSRRLAPWRRHSAGNADAALRWRILTMHLPWLRWLALSRNTRLPSSSTARSVAAWRQPRGGDMSAQRLRGDAMPRSARMCQDTVLPAACILSLRIRTRNWRCTCVSGRLSNTKHAGDTAACIRRQDRDAGAIATVRQNRNDSHLRQRRQARSALAAKAALATT